MRYQKGKGKKIEFPKQHTVFEVKKSPVTGIPCIYPIKLTTLVCNCFTFSRKYRRGSKKRILVTNSIFKDVPTKIYYTKQKDAESELFKQLESLKKSLGHQHSIITTQIREIEKYER